MPRNIFLSGNWKYWSALTTVSLQFLFFFYFHRRVSRDMNNYFRGSSPGEGLRERESFRGYPSLHSFLGWYAKWRKASVSFVMCVLLSGCPHGTTRLALDEF